jgi:hypothetical protein
MKHKPKSIDFGKSKPKPLASAKRAMATFLLTAEKSKSPTAASAELEEPRVASVNARPTWLEHIASVSPDEIAEQGADISQLRVEILKAKEDLLQAEFRLEEDERRLAGMKRSLMKLARW